MPEALRLPCPDLAAARILTNAVELLERHPDVEIVTREIGKPAPKSALVDALRQGAPESLVAFHAAMDGFRFAWRFRGDRSDFKSGNGGQLWIPPLAMAFDALGPVLEGLERPMRFLDRTPYELHFDCCVVWIEEEGICVYDGEYLHQLCSDVAGYADLAASSLFVADWLGAYCQYTYDPDVASLIERTRRRLGLPANA
jgi:hypothetical protein